MRTAGSNRLRGELAGNELRTRKEYVSDRDAGFKQPLERRKLLTRWAFEYFDQTGTLAAVSLVGVAGGPAGLALLVGLSTGILINKATKKVSVVQIGQFMAERAAVAATEIRRAAQPKLKDIG